MFKICVILLLFHPGHTTMTTIDQVRGTDSLKVFARLNYELFLKDFQQTVNDDISIEDLRKYKPFPADLATTYFNSKFFIHINGKNLIGKLLKTGEAESDIILSFLYKQEKKIKTLTLRNTFLMGLFSDVENLTIIKIKDLETEIKFNQEHKERTFVLK